MGRGAALTLLLVLGPIILAVMVQRVTQRASAAELAQARQLARIVRPGCAGAHRIARFQLRQQPFEKEALRKACIGYHEIVAGHTMPSELRPLVEKLVPER